MSLFYVATLATWVLVEAEDEEQAAVLAVDEFAKLGKTNPDIKTIRPATHRDCYWPQYYHLAEKVGK